MRIVSLTFLVIRTFVVVLLLNLAAWASYGQGQNSALTLPKIIPPSPEAASLGKYGDLPVSLNNGSVNVTIPLYTIQGKETSLPIALNYSSSGIRVEEVASWAGLGWSTEAGGVITRAMRGLPDEGPNGFFIRYNQWLQLKDQPYTTRDSDDPRYIFEDRVAYGQYDLEPDMFYFNFAGYSGRFILRKDAISQTLVPVIIPYQSLKIETTLLNQIGQTMAWTITSPDGTRYLFEIKDAEVTQSSAGTYASAWYLSKIISANSKDVVSFQYASNELGNPTTLDPFTSVTLQKSNCLGADCSACMEPLSPPSPVFTDVLIRTKRLEKINYQDLEVEFISDGNRTDLDPMFSPPGRRLLSVRINKHTSSTPINLKTFQFSYGYFDSGEQFGKRLRLESILEAGKKPYQFIYNSTAMPSYHSYAKDHWGYYNGAHSNLSLLPGLSPSETGFDPHPVIGANREANPIYAKACTLEKIVYPTGGSTSFEYESNTVAQSREVNAAVTASVSGGNTTTGMNAKELAIRTHYAASDMDMVNPPRVKIQEITFLQGTQATIMVKVTNNLTGGALPQPILEAHIYSGNQTLDPDNPLRLYQTQSTLTDSQYFPAGTYTIAAIASQANVKIDITVSYSTIINDQNYTVGGLRIAKMVDYDGLHNDKKTISEYKYVSNYIDYMKGLTPLQTSSQLFSTINYKKRTPCGNLVIAASNVNTFTTIEGGFIGYNEVAVVKNGGSSGITVYKYLNSPADYARSQLLEQTQYDNQYKQVNQVLNEYSVGEYMISSLPKTRIEANGTRVRAGFSPVGSIQGCVCREGGTASNYHVFDIDQKSYATSFVYLKRSDEKRFDQNDPNKFTQITTRFEYEGIRNEVAPENRHTQLSKEIQEVNSGERIIKHRLYPFDYLSQQADGTILALRNKNMQQTLVQQTTIREKVNGSTVSSQQVIGSTITRFQQNANDQILPQQVLEFESVVAPSVTDANAFPTYIPINGTPTNGFSSRLLFERYDQKGNLLQVRQKDGIAISYLWGYDGRYPIAEIKNADYTEILSALGMTEQQVNALTDESTIRSAMNTLRLNLKKAMVTSFTHDPLVGITTQTGPDGITVLYEYDELQRLKVVKDQQGNIVKRYQYHYSGQPQPQD
jgi:YD repeat-containing protein